MPRDLAALEAEYYNKPAQVARRRIPAGKTVNIDAYGAAYHLISSTGNRTVFVATDTTNEVPLSVGTTQDFPRYFRFHSLAVRNTAAFDVDIVLWYGFGGYTPHSYFLSEAPTELVAQELAGGLIPGGGSVTLPGIPSGNRIMRKAVIVSNDDPSQKLTITDGTNAALRVYPFTSVRLDASGPVKVVNSNGGAVSACVSEIWYVTQ